MRSNVFLHNLILSAVNGVIAADKSGRSKTLDRNQAKEAYVAPDFPNATGNMTKPKEVFPQ
jgi:hypothetical protein